MRFVGGFTSDKASPRFMAFVDDFSRVLFVLGIAVESKSVLRLSVRDLVDPKIYQSTGFST